MKRKRLPNLVTSLYDKISSILKEVVVMNESGSFVKNVMRIV